MINRVDMEWVNEQLAFFIVKEEDKCVGCENAELVRDECDEWWRCTLPDGRNACPYKGVK